MPKAFLITPFTQERAGNEDPDTFEAVQDAVRQAVAAAGLELIHPARMGAGGAIMDQVREEIARADVVLAILTGLNPNVFYEVGMALESAARPPLLIVKSADNIPFDIRHLRYWTYETPEKLQSLAASLTPAIRETLALMPRKRGPQPLLEMKTVPISDKSRLNFRARGLPLVGRTHEMSLLQGFLEAPQKFLWQAIHGPGGSGKSRLALELSLANRSRWFAGFLPERNGFENQWSSWRPFHPTLIIIDEIERQTEAVKTILQALSLAEAEFSHPVRLLLLGRVRAREVEKLLNSDPFDWEALYEPSAHGPALALDRLGPEDAETIVNSLAQGREWSRDILDQDPALRLPLFAILTGLAIAQGREELNWDRESVSRFVLERNHTRHWTECTKEDENALAYVSIAGSRPAHAMASLSLTELFPRDAEQMLEHNQVMADHAELVLMPLEPEVLGQLFVLDLLGREPTSHAMTDRGHRVVAAAFRTLHGQADFAFKALMHFPEHPALPRLIAAMVPEWDAASSMVWGIGVPALVDDIGGLVRSGNAQLALTFVAAIHILRRRGYPEAEAFGCGADFNLVSSLAKTGRLDEALKALHAFEREAAATSLCMVDVGKAYANTIGSAVEQSCHEQGRMLTARLLDLADGHPELRFYAADATINGVKAAAHAQEAAGFLQRCLSWIKSEPDTSDLAEECARIALNVANRCGREQEGHIGVQVFNQILALLLNPPHARIPPDSVGRVAIPVAVLAPLLPPAERDEFIDGLGRLSRTHSDGDTQWNCVLALSNVIHTAARGHSEYALKAFEMMCALYADWPDWSVDHVLVSAARMIMGGDASVVGPHVRALLLKHLPAALAPEYVAGKEAQWGVDLSSMKGSSKPS